MSLRILVAVSVLCGCGCQRNDEAGELRRRLQLMEDRLLKVESQFRVFAGTNISAQSAAIAASGPWRRADIEWRTELREDFRALHLQVLQRPTLLDVNTEVQRVLDERAAAFRNQQAGKPAAALPGAAKAEPLKDGIPLSIWNKVAADAAAKWGGNFEMQAYEIKNQVEAWLKIHR